jgi:hypothetical protein
MNFNAQDMSGPERCFSPPGALAQLAIRSSTTT